MAFDSVIGDQLGFVECYQYTRSLGCRDTKLFVLIVFDKLLGSPGRGRLNVGDQSPRKNSGSHIDASHSRQPLVKGERLVRYEVNAVMLTRCWKHE